MDREKQFEAIGCDGDYDVVILGGGVNGACLYDRLCRDGYRTLLVDRGDFASGTSQASGMMVWGGLLYLRNFDLSTVFQLSLDRDRMVRDMPSRLSPQSMRYLPSSRGGASHALVHAGLWFYWMLAMGQRHAPGSQDDFAELDLLRPGLVRGSLTYEEAVLDSSDARFVFRWIAPHGGSGQLALNYARVTGSHSRLDDRWHLDLEDLRSGESVAVRAALIVNCTGVWTDAVNASFGISTPFRHAFSKGVYVAVPRPEQHRSSLFFELDEHRDVISFVPWGPVSLWGPTETAIGDLAEGMAATGEDVDYLLGQYRRRFREPVATDDIVSIRCGVRPLVVERDYQQSCYPLELSRRQEVVSDQERPWISCYGGKLTGCVRMAARTAAIVARTVSPSRAHQLPDDDWERGMETATFPGLDESVPSAAWCARRELCCTLTDYLRRRTNIGPWVPRMGLGRHDEHAPALREYALQIARGDTVEAERLFAEHRQLVVRELDPLLAAS